MLYLKIIMFALICLDIGCDTQNPTISMLVQSHGNAVAMITVQNEAGEDTGQGSGVLISSDGKLVTNFHVIKGAASAYIKLREGPIYHVKGEIVKLENKDLALLQVDGQNLPFAKIGNSDSVKVGDQVVAIGNPRGLENSVSEGIISGRREMPEFGDTKLLQFTAPISPGSSGGALLNFAGAVIGITTASIESGQNLNLAVPVNEIKPYIDETLLAYQYSESERPTAVSSSMPLTSRDKIFYGIIFIFLMVSIFVLSTYLFKMSIDHNESPIAASSKWGAIMLIAFWIVPFSFYEFVIRETFDPNWGFWIGIGVALLILIFVMQTRKPSST